MATGKTETPASGGIDFSKTFGAGTGNNTGGNQKEQVKAQVWLNIGYVAEGAGNDGEDRFVSLPVGIPLDTQEPLPTNARNVDYAKFNAARNDLLAQALAAGEKLAPGEEQFLNLRIQIRRVEDKRADVGMTEDNQFAMPKDMQLVG